MGKSRPRRGAAHGRRNQVAIDPVGSDFLGCIVFPWMAAQASCWLVRRRRRTIESIKLWQTKRPRPPRFWACFSDHLANTDRRAPSYYAIFNLTIRPRLLSSTLGSSRRPSAAWDAPGMEDDTMARFDQARKAVVGRGGSLPVRDDDEITRKLSMLIPWLYGFKLDFRFR